LENDLQARPNKLTLSNETRSESADDFILGNFAKYANSDLANQQRQTCSKPLFHPSVISTQSSDLRLANATRLNVFAMNKLTSI
jgi:hypothetical protein